ncbi:MAG: hypothetical protein ACYTEI_14630, partial [Planctomycetota bacterium]
MLIVRWGERRFLVPEAGVIEFCNEFNSGRIDTRLAAFVMERTGISDPEQTYGARGTIKRPPEPFPELPPEYHGMLLEAPITVRLVDVGSPESGPMPTPPPTKMTWVRVNGRADAGTNDGVFACMRFHVVEPPLFDFAVVVDVQRDSCTVRFRDWLLEGKKGVRPQVGWVLSTRHWIREERPQAPSNDRTPRSTERPTTRPASGDPNPPAPGFDAEGSDPEAIWIADAVMARMGGRRAWDRTRYVTWSFFDRRRHVWDKHAGRVRVERKG